MKLRLGFWYGVLDGLTIITGAVIGVLAVMGLWGAWNE